MRNINIYLLRRLFVVVISILFFGVTSIYAQIGNLGIYGSAPTPESTPFTCGEPRYARLSPYPDLTAGEGIPSTNWTYTLPLNGPKNFNFYYSSDGMGFLSGGGYSVTYLNSGNVNCYGNPDIVTYRNFGPHTSGVQVRPFNPPPPGGATTVGIHAIVRAMIPGGGGTTTVPLEDATAYTITGGYLINARTNGNGYFSLYYGNANPNIFLPDINHPDVYIAGVYNGCTYTWFDPSPLWEPESDPNSPAYYANEGAESNLGTINIASGSPGCAP